MNVKSMTAETITPIKEIIGLSNLVIRKMLSVKIIKPIIPLMTIKGSLIEISESIIDITKIIMTINAHLTVLFLKSYFSPNNL